MSEIILCEVLKLNTRKRSFINKFSNISGGHEPPVIEQLSELLSHDSVYYDIGSHYGYHISAAKEIGIKSANIHAFEGDQKHFEILKMNAPQAHTHNLFVGSNSSEPDQISLDEYAKRNDPPDVLKIDVEGAEYNVLDGMISVIEDYKPDMLIEIHPQYLGKFNASEESVRNFLSDYGYDLLGFPHQEDTDPKPLSKDGRPSDGYPYEEYFIKAT